MFEGYCPLVKLKCPVIPRLPKDRRKNLLFCSYMAVCPTYLKIPATYLQDWTMQKKDSFSIPLQKGLLG